MRYRSDPTLPPISYNARRDEVTILQIDSHGTTEVVFKGYLTTGGEFLVQPVFF